MKEELKEIFKNHNFTDKEAEDIFSIIECMIENAIEKHEEYINDPFR